MLRKLSICSLLSLTLLGCGGSKETPDPKPTGGNVTAAAKPADAPKKVEITPPTIGKDLIPRAVLFADPDRSRVRISPNGKQISWLAPKDGISNLWVASARAPDKAEAVTDDKGRGIFAYAWAPDGKQLLYVQDKAGDENWRLYGVNLKTKKVRAFTPEGKVRASITHISAANKKEVLVSHNARDPKFFDVFKLSLKTGKLKLIEENKEFIAFVADDKLKVKLAMKQNAAGATEVFKKKGKKWSLFFTVAYEDDMPFNVLGFNKKATKLYVADSTGRDTGALVEIDMRSGKRKELAAVELADIQSIAMHPRSKKVEAYTSTYERKKMVALDKKFAKHLEAIGKLAEGADIEITDRSADDKKWIVAAFYDDGPWKYFLYDSKKKKGSPLFSSHKTLEGQPLTKMHSRVIEAKDGLKLVSYLSLPKASDPDGDGKPDKALPMVLFVHGGPWARDGWGYNPYHQWLANRGYAVLSVNYRGSTGFGKKFVNAADKEWAGKMHEDLLDAVAWAVKEGVANEKAVAIMGGSYGGYATLVGLSFTPEAFACGVDIVGPSNLDTLLKSIPPYWAPMIETFAKRVGDPRTDEGKKLLAERSPLTRADQIVRPLLIGQGANDPRVKQAESDQIVQAMSAKGIPVTYVLYPDEGHGFRRPPNRMSFNAVSEVFLAQCLSGVYEAYGDDFQGSTIEVKSGSDQVYGLDKALAGIQKPAPVEEKPVEEKPVEEKPTPVEEKPVEEKPVEEKPTPVEEKPVEKPADHGDASKSGLQVGVMAPNFRLPVVNSVKETMKKWGPGDWGPGENQKKLIIMSFFATWCEPCKKEMPELARLYDQYKDQGLGVALVSIDKGIDQRDVVIQLADDKGVKFPVVHDRFQVVARRYEAERLPYMLMMGPDRKIHTKHVGYTDEVKANLENEIKKHLGL